MITVQTRMLAVNGNVEAARAGEYGRGFSVVAGDIRSLANESGENADKIKELVKSIRPRSIRVAVDIQQAGMTAKAEVEKAKTTTADLEKMVTQSAEVVEGMKVIGKGAEESATALQQAVKASQQMSNSAEEIEQGQRGRRDGCRAGLDCGAGNRASNRRNRLAGRRSAERLIIRR